MLCKLSVEVRSWYVLFYGGISRILKHVRSYPRKDVTMMRLLGWKNLRRRLQEPSGIPSIGLPTWVFSNYADTSIGESAFG